ncbi:DUF222 domain-containing protein [Nocardioides sp. HDW12B]|uniref:HNH endonuclease signature motif containing protein n=1 Tax=Nocardioides sp. HDW12B TaxID=2714939 RepID=UPI0014096ACF|nr:HNH endonuclease signature motif containing protein [Nocardioides sp. HDW12B]QIK66233.1 DUF222 domain-containing protein [Nocardioides sp. HDW12B]
MSAAPLISASGTDARVEVLDLNAAEALSFVTDRRRATDLAAAQELEGVAHWADLHRVGRADLLRGAVGAVDREIRDALPCRPLRDDETALGRERELRLAGQGAFMIEEYAVAELATALGLTEHSGRAYVGQAVELRDRLPRCWAQVMAGRLPVWEARQVAERTIPLSDETAAAVDAAVAPFAHRMTVGRIARLVEAAVLRHQPDLAAERAAEAAEHRGVWFDDQLDGTTDLSAHLDTPDAAALDHALDSVATTLGRLGDTDSRAVRRARALGVLADPQYALDLDATADGTGQSDDPATAARRVTPVRAVPTLHLHLHLDAVSAFGLDGSRAGNTEPGADQAEVDLVRVDRAGRRLGARTRETLERWVAGLTPGAGLHVTPVVDLTEEIAVDQYEIPSRLRRQVVERDPTCMFPWCGNAGRHDLDHLLAYVPMDEGGPPGQTSTSNLHRLCRFHHRLKTHGRWRVDRPPGGADPGVVWTSPHGRRYLVTSDGTTRLDPVEPPRS